MKKVFGLALGILTAIGGFADNADHDGPCQREPEP